MADLRTQRQDGLGSSYTLERELGRGGMATVFLARDLKHDRPVALVGSLLSLARLAPDRPRVRAAPANPRFEWLAGGTA